MDRYQEASKGKEEALSFYKQNVYLAGKEAKYLKGYKIGKNGKLDNALAEFYKDLNVLGSCMPLRIRKEQGVFKLADIIEKEMKRKK